MTRMLFHGTISELARRLADDAEAVCRAYLSNGRRNGGYWIVGDVQGTPGRSLFVRLTGKRAGKWQDGATSEYGDLLDLIRLNKGYASVHEAADEARLFLRDPAPACASRDDRPVKPRNTAVMARRLFATARPVPGTLAETYLRERGIAGPLDWPSLRFHPACYYRPEDDAHPPQGWPALLGAVTGPHGKLTGLQRTWLASDGGGKAPFLTPRKALGHLLGNAVRFGAPDGVMAAGEGIETVLSLLTLFPALPMAAALSATHLAAFSLPPSLARLYVLRDNDAAGQFAAERLSQRCRDAGIDCRVLTPKGKDLNADLRAGPARAVKQRMLAQMAAADRIRFRR